VCARKPSRFKDWWQGFVLSGIDWWNVLVGRDLVSVVLDKFGGSLVGTFLLFSLFLFLIFICYKS